MDEPPDQDTSIIGQYYLHALILKQYSRQRIRHADVKSNHWFRFFPKGTTNKEQLYFFSTLQLRTTILSWHWLHDNIVLVSTTIIEICRSIYYYIKLKANSKEDTDRGLCHVLYSQSGLRLTENRSEIHHWHIWLSKTIPILSTQCRGAAWIHLTRLHWMRGEPKWA